MLRHGKGSLAGASLSAGRARSVDLGTVRWDRYAYMFAYAFELMLFKTRGFFAPAGTKFFFIPGYTAMLAAHGIASLLVMLLWSRRFKKLIWASAAVTAAGLIPYLLLPVGMPRLICGMVAYAGLGGCVTAARCGYAYALNNAERLLGMLVMFFYCAAMFYARAAGADGFWCTVVLPLVLLAAMCFCLLRFREEDLEIRETSTPQDEKGLYFALALFIAYYVIDGFNWGMVDSSYREEFTFLCVGMVLAGVFFAVALTRLRLDLWHLWTVFLGVSGVMALLAILSAGGGSQKPMYFFSGLSLLGWPLSMYMLGGVHRQLASLKLLKRSTVVFVIVSPLVCFPVDLIEAYLPRLMPPATLIAVFLVLLLTLAFSHFGYVHLFSTPLGALQPPAPEPSAPEISAPEISAPEPPAPPAQEADPFAGFGLTPRQREVALMLLQAKTRRQIAGELALSESTVKTHTSELYKKLNINSRAELFRLFGVKNGD